ncbi:Cancer- nucleoside-triphosphatase [Clonorchis sinensis]|uniref:Cancer- nucleoside-triphosphatase n=1 Tax=Clonorchis sinensis TaxID=79923 RepID=A0A3R7H2Q8_CLOSI|nr:Cancer- nucleoside-triphosphatase [Clonorchis sinensis]
MQRPKHNILLFTGKPGIGKTTLVSRLVTQLSKHVGVYLTGFFTEEVRVKEANRPPHRIGFDVVSLEHDTRNLSLALNKRAPLARIHSTSTKDLPRVGQYVVELESFEAVCVPCMKGVLEQCQQSLVDENIPGNMQTNITVCVIDEIGKMELMSNSFKRLVSDLIDRVSKSRQTVLVATIPSARLPDGRRGIPFVDELCSRPDVDLTEMTYSNRSFLPDQVYQAIISRLPA